MRKMMDNGFDGTANVAEQLANLLLPAGYALFGKVDLRIVCEEIQEASPIGGNPCVAQSLQIFERNRLPLLVRHCVFGECHPRFPPESCHEQRNEPALGTNFLAVILYSPIQQPLALARLASQAIGRLCHARIRPIAGHCQTKFYSACSGARARSSATIFAHESLPRSASFEVENVLYLFALTPFFGEDGDASYRYLLASQRRKHRLAVYRLLPDTQPRSSHSRPRPCRDAPVGACRVL